MSTTNMATVNRFGRLAVCTSGNKIGVFQLGSSEWREIPIQTTKNQNAEEGQKLEDSDAHGSNKILACACSQDGHLFAVGDDNKYLSIYNSKEAWKLISKRLVSRRCTRLQFTQNGAAILLADKSGDVFLFSVTEPEKPGELILGHLSMLTDLMLIQDEKFVVTCDRDEKIRISHFPNAYNIHTYCLAHTEFVSRLLYIKDKDVIVSGGGDGTVRFWRENKQLLCLPWSCEAPPVEQGDKEKTTPTIKCLSYSPEQHALLVTCDILPCLRVYSLSWSRAEEILSVAADIRQEVTFSQPPWDICVDQSSLWWILLPVEGETVSVWKFFDGQLQKVDDSTPGCEEVGVTVNQVNSSWVFFKESMSADNMFSSLRKMKVDNMKEYLERKKERLSGKGQSEELGKAPAKKQKIS